MARPAISRLKRSTLSFVSRRCFKRRRMMDWLFPSASLRACFVLCSPRLCSGQALFIAYFMDVKIAKQILEKVQKDYDLIAKEWHAHRFAPRPIQFELTKPIKTGQRVLDVGCGNGVLYDVLAPKSIEYTGMDVSARLLRIAKKRAGRLKRGRELNSLNFKFVKSSVLEMPFQDGIFDWVLAFAVLHHLPGPYQKKAVAEMYRVLKPGGQVVISVWNLYSDYAKEKFKIAKQLKKRPKGWGKKDLTIPWLARPEVRIKRYVYRFDKKELKELFKKAGFRDIKCFVASPSGRQTDISRGYNINLTAEK